WAFNRPKPKSTSPPHQHFFTLKSAPYGYIHPRIDAMRVDNVDMGDTNDSEHRAPPDAISSGEPFLDLDALAFDPSALESNAYEPTFENGLEGNEFEFNFDDLWSADPSASRRYQLAT
ncbi:hypothetical protein FOXYS1_16042, partial [Fusarium oxysporum]